MVDLSGAVRESAMIREVQRDTWGKRLLHVDFTRVTADERVEVELPVELRGEAPGFREGGVVEQVTHRLTIECRASAIPEKLELSVNELKLNESLTAADIELPPGASLLDEAQTVIVSCSPPVEMPEEVERPAEEEPEVIGAKEKEEGEGEKAS
jgi:large subunit ribosomal protein L25